MISCGCPQCGYNMPSWCYLGHLALSLRSHLGANSRSSCFLCWAILVFSRGSQLSHTTPPWSHLCHLALSLRGYIGASSQYSSFFFWAILVFSGRPLCLYSMPPWCYLDHLALLLRGHLGASSNSSSVFLWTILVLTSREAQIGTIEETRGLGAGTKIDTQRKSNIAKMAPNLHRVRSLGPPRKDQDGHSKIKQDGHGETTMA